MKKLILVCLLFLSTIALFAEKINLHTGESFGVSNTDYFYPKDISFTGAKCTISAIKKVEDNLDNYEHLIKLYDRILADNGIDIETLTAELGTSVSI